MLYALLFAVAFEPVDALPDCLPDSAVVEVAVTVEVAPTKTRGVVSRRPHPTCANCPDILEYGWIEAESVDQAARKLERWRELPKDEVKRLEKIVDAPAIAKALCQEWSMGSCGMLCRAGGSQLFDVFEDGTVKLAEQQPASAPDEGVHSGGDRMRRWFSRRR